MLRPLPAGAAAPITGKQAPGFYRYKVGSFECTPLNDGALTYPISADYVTNVSKDQVIAAAAAAYFPKDMVVCPYNPQVINTGSKLVLIDTGWGPGVDPAVGHVLHNMAAAGHRAGSGGHRDHLPFSSRPYQRTAEGRRRARLSERRDQGPVAGVGVLDERRQHVEGVRRA